MTTYQLVLYVHLLSLLLATGAAAITHVAHTGLRRAATLSEAGRLGLTLKAASRAFPPAVVGLLGSGAYLVSDAWSWSAPWVLAALSGLAAIVLVGDLVNGRHGRRVGEAIGRTLARQGDGPVTGEVTRLLERPLAVAAAFMPTTTMLGVVFVMTAKPGAAGSAAALLVAVAASALCAAVPVRRPGATAPARAGEAT